MSDDEQPERLECWMCRAAARDALAAGAEPCPIASIVTRLEVNGVVDGRTFFRFDVRLCGLHLASYVFELGRLAGDAHRRP